MTTEVATPAAAEKPAAPAAAAVSADALAKAIPDAEKPAAELKLTAPHGIDDAYVAGLSEFAKAEGLTQKQAEAWLTRESASRADAAKAKVETDKATAQSNLDQIRTQYSAARVTELRASIGQYIDKHAAPALAKWLVEGDNPPILNPDVFNFFAQLADAGREGSIVKSDKPAKTAPQTAAERFPQTYAQMTPAQRVAAGFA